MSQEAGTPLETGLVMKEDARAGRKAKTHFRDGKQEGACHFASTLESGFLLQAYENFFLVTFETWLAWHFYVDLTVLVKIPLAYLLSYRCVPAYLRSLMEQMA